MNIDQLTDLLRGWDGDTDVVIVVDHPNGDDIEDGAILTIDSPRDIWFSSDAVRIRGHYQVDEDEDVEEEEEEDDDIQ
jgi:hypothetical protein